ncbi:MAG: DUF4342 domain-containing protein [Taibaiella sp.]|nr:DUF4342 domain-containing protein [Taibaiella sp.]
MDHTIAVSMNKEYFFVKGEELLEKIREIIAEGNVRKIIISDRTGSEIMSFSCKHWCGGRIAGTCIRSGRCSCSAAYGLQNHRGAYGAGR